LPSCPIVVEISTLSWMNLKSEIVAVVKRYMGVRSVEVKKEVDGNIEAISIDVLLDIHRT